MILTVPALWLFDIGSVSALVYTVGCTVMTHHQEVSLQKAGKKM